MDCKNQRLIYICICVKHEETRGVAGCPRMGGKVRICAAMTALWARHTPCVAPLFRVAPYAAQIAPWGACPPSKTYHQSGWIWEYFIHVSVTLMVCFEDVGHFTDGDIGCGIDIVNDLLHARDLETVDDEIDHCFFGIGETAACVDTCET